MRVGYFVVWHPDLGMLFERGTMHGHDIAAAMFQESTNLTMRATKIVFMASDGSLEVIKDRNGPYGPLTVRPAVRPVVDVTPPTDKVSVPCWCRACAR